MKLILLRHSLKIGFIGLSKVKSGKMPSGIIPFLIAHFAYVNKIQKIPNNRGYIINADDVFDIFGLLLNPTNQIKIKKKTTRTNENRYDEWVKIPGFSNPNTLKAKDILHLLLSFPNGGGDFKKLFVLYVVSILLVPLPDFKIRKTFYSTIANFSRINSF